MVWLTEKLDLKRVIFDEIKSDKGKIFKWENVRTIISMGENYDLENGTLHDFLNTTMLDQQKNENNNRSENKVNLLTFHSSKGLEFPACFLVGIEDRLLPHERSLIDGSLEEERRLFYVAITRAKKYLTLSMTKKRLFHGKETPTNPSRFLFEIPKDLLEIETWNHPLSFQH